MLSETYRVGSWTSSAITNDTNSHFIIIFSGHVPLFVSHLVVLYFTRSPVLA